MRSRTTFGIVCCATAMTILGASVAVSREILELPVFYAQAARYAVAAAILGAIATRQPRVATADLAVAPSPRWRTVGRLALLAATGLVLFNVVVLAALRRADPEVLGSVIGCTPLALAAAGPIQQRRRPETRLLQAAAVVVVGAAIVQGTGRTSLTGLLLAVAALACEAAFSLVAAPLLPRLGAVRVSAAACAIAIPMLLVAGLLAGERRARLPRRLPHRRRVRRLVHGHRQPRGRAGGPLRRPRSGRVARRCCRARSNAAGAGTGHRRAPRGCRHRARPQIGTATSRDQVVRPSSRSAKGSG
jgi:drug/metabolite transporter (DMT)-like permease